MAQARHGRLSSVATAVAPVRVAVYCRKSTDENLDSAFNSLDAQREACLAYITSQKHQGWVPCPVTFEDAAYSGGTLDRPALQKLLKAVEAGEVQCVAVYRADRLSRRLLDFLQLVEFLDKHGCAFVSITEQFNTSTPGGRLYQHMLLSFAEYERALIGERTRHKVHAARRKGRFTGGTLILGYDCDPRGGKLIANNDEAMIVQEIFRIFLANQSLIATVTELDSRSFTLKRWLTRDGKEVGGGRFDKHSLRRLLTNFAYIGKVNFQGTIYDGEHDAIVPPKVFREVQRVLNETQSNGGAAHRNKHGALLRSILRCGACGSAMIHAPSRKGARLFRYYRCSQSMKRGVASCPHGSVRAEKIEAFVVSQIKRIGADPALRDEVFRQALAQLEAERRGCKVETRSLERETAKARKDVERLVTTLSRSTGPAADAVHVELAKAQERVGVLVARLGEVREREVALAAQQVDEADLARALEAFTPIWDVLLTPEKERVLGLLIEKVGYDGRDGKLTIRFRLDGIASLAAETAAEATP
jgi:site-specific DNA recombinase